MKAVRSWCSAGAGPVLFQAKRWLCFALPLRSSCPCTSGRCSACWWLLSHLFSLPLVTIVVCVLYLMLFPLTPITNGPSVYPSANSQSALLTEEILQPRERLRRMQCRAGASLNSAAWHHLDSLVFGRHRWRMAAWKSAYATTRKASLLLQEPVAKPLLAQHWEICRCW